MNYLFDIAREKFGTAQMNWLTDTHRAIALAEGHGLTAASTTLSQVPASIRIGTSVVLTGKTAEKGYLKALPTRLPALLDSRKVIALVVYREGGSEATSDLVAFIDTAYGMPFKPIGIDYYVGWQIANSGVLRL